ncbi:glucose-1-phosphate thymidylyltransferase [Streptomyces iconiensis]|uniref:Glucose-1-phosphate thymidylyltransferase n=1 Tax=Streptomyces iconiensis TaxID=1384038 RepID=A0ABT7A8B8_9ACTN|nr:glucose-1-phosphate thymidylyltransferase [Streptomyces iconiensis]MDJ1136873.1 glucose-1-phosphate thymidylyltransferase [Streptomyces iconiensis]
MKALVLAGGLGTRLRPFSYSTAKQLIPVANKPVLHYGLEAVRDAGITDVGIVVGGTAEQIRESVGSGERFGLSVTYIAQEVPMGLAHCVAIAQDFLGDDDFVMYLGDNLVLGGIQGVVDAFRGARPAATLMVGKVGNPAEYGIAQVDGADRVTAVAEKSPEPFSDLAIVGVYVFSPTVHEAVRRNALGSRGEYEITDAIGWLIDHGHPVTAHTCADYWRDTGRVSDLLDCNREMLRLLVPGIHGRVDADCEILGPVRIEEGARVAGSRIRGPALIGRSAVVSGSVIGPHTSVGDHCVLTDAGVEGAILLDGASVRGVPAIRDSVIGRGAVVDRADESHHLVVGDRSRVVIRS